MRAENLRAVLSRATCLLRLRHCRMDLLSWAKSCARCSLYYAKWMPSSL